MIQVSIGYSCSLLALISKLPPYFILPKIWLFRVVLQVITFISAISCFGL
jgi:hypothetical protein